MEPRGRYAETLFLLAGAVRYKVLALPTSIKIDEKTDPRKEVHTKHVFLWKYAKLWENGVSVSPAKFPCCVPFRNKKTKVAKETPKGAQGGPGMLKVTKIGPKWCPKASQISKKKKPQQPKEHLPYRIKLKWKKTPELSPVLFSQILCFLRFSEGLFSLSLQCQARWRGCAPALMDNLKYR